jgi:uncharacterized membrane protein
MLFRPRSFESWWKLLLLGSICCNIALASYVAVQWLRTERPLVETVIPSGIVGRLAGRLPKSDAEILWSAYHSKEVELSAAQADYLHSLAKSSHLLTAKDFDESNFRRTVSESRDKRLKLADLVAETLVEAITQMSPEGRRKLVDPTRMH